MSQLKLVNVEPAEGIADDLDDRRAAYEVPAVARTPSPAVSRATSRQAYFFAGHLLDKCAGVMSTLHLLVRNDLIAVELEGSDVLVYPQAGCDARKLLTLGGVLVTVRDKPGQVK